MTRWFGAAMLIAVSLAVGLAFDIPASARAAVPARTAVHPAQAGDVSARRLHRHRYRYVSRPSYPYYEGRPTYYAPAPFFPIPPFFGYGWEPY